MAYTCPTCKWFTNYDAPTKEGYVGKCRYKPPQVVVIDDEAVTVWPQCFADDWCKDWETRA